MRLELSNQVARVEIKTIGETWNESHAGPVISVGGTARAVVDRPH